MLWLKTIHKQIKSFCDKWFFPHLLRKVDNEENDSVCFQQELGRLVLLRELEYFGELAWLEQLKKNLMIVCID